MQCNLSRYSNFFLVLSHIQGRRGSFRVTGVWSGGINFVRCVTSLHFSLTANSSFYINPALSSHLVLWCHTKLLTDSGISGKIQCLRENQHLGFSLSVRSLFVPVEIFSLSVSKIPFCSRQDMFYPFLFSLRYFNWENLYFGIFTLCKIPFCSRWDIEKWKKRLMRSDWGN